MGIDGRLEGRVGGVIFWRIPEEVLSAESVVSVIPFGFGSGGRHCDQRNRSQAGGIDGFG